MPFAIIIFTLFLSIQGHAFARCTQNTIEVAWRHYQHPDNQATIFLLGVTHWALPQFYEELENFIVGMDVIREGVGDSLEDRRFVKNQFKQLSPSYKDLFQALTSWRGIKNPLHQIYQPQLDYLACKSVIHADYGLQASNLSWILRKQNPSDHENYLRYHAQVLLGENGSLEINRDTVARVWKARTEKIAFPRPKDILLFQQEKIQNNNPICSERTIFCIERIMSSLFGLLEEQEQPRRIAIIFGTNHLPIVQLILLLLEWEMVGERWLFVAKL